MKWSNKNDYDIMDDLKDAGWNIVRENPGIDCQDWINELMRQYPAEVVDAFGTTPGEVFHELTDLWENGEYTDPDSGEYDTFQGWAEYFATDPDCLQERLEVANKRIKELENELEKAKCEIRRLEREKDARQ